jgi:hypothetical protein
MVSGIFWWCLLVLMNLVHIFALVLGLTGCMLVSGVATARRGAVVDLGGTALGLALFPSALSLWTYVIYALSSWALPGAALYIAGPAVFGLVAIARYFPAFAGETRAANLDWRFLILSMAAFGPVLLAIAGESATPRGAGDISQYLSEASALSSVMRTGFSGPLDWLRFGPADTAHPHSLSWTLYLAWGFLGSASPGFDTDALPRAMVGLAHLSVIAAIFGVLSLFAKRPFIAAFLSVGLLLYDPAWKWELAASSRDTFYSAPLLVMIALLAKAGEGRGTHRFVTPTTIGLLIAVYGATMGHSIGIAYAASALLAVWIAKLIELGKNSFSLPDLRWATLAVAAAMVYYAVQYLTRSSGQMGYEYVYYQDPALIEYFVASRPFFKSANFVEVLQYLLNDVNVSVSLAIAVVAALVAVISHGKKAFFEPDTQPIFLPMLVFWMTLSAMVLAPIKLDGITLSSALIANFRYSLCLRLFVFLMAPLAIAFLWHKLVVIYPMRLPVIFPNSVWALIPLFAFVAWGGIGNLKYNALVYAIHREIIELERSVCQQFVDRGGRRIYVGSAGMIYRCGKSSRNLFTADGSAIIAQRQDADFERVLALKEVDTIVMYVLDQKWEKTALYGYLDLHWHKEKKSQRMTIFIRPV